MAPQTLAAAADLDHLPEDTRADHWSLALLLSRTPAVLQGAVGSLELGAVAKHAYLLARTFNSFYHRFPVVQESNAATRAARTAIVKLYHEGMVALLELMGIAVPQRM